MGLSPNQWIILFALIDKLVNTPDLTADEKAKVLAVQADKAAATTNVVEFAAYIDQEMS